MRKIVFMSIIILLAAVMQVHALPTLQLDAFPGTYVNGDTGAGETDSTVTTVNAFTLRALLDPDGSDIKSKKLSYDDFDYFISIALLSDEDLGNDTTNPAPDYGSFDFDSQTFNVTADLTYGTPPMAAIFEDNDDLPGHGVFPTWYEEYGFTWDASQTITPAYNVQTGDTQANNTLYYVDFAVDMASLSAPGSYSGLHFDLYGYKRPTTTGEAIDTSTLINAPFSKDVTSFHDDGGGGGGGGGGGPVPEPSTIFMLGIGLLAVGSWRRKKKK